MLQERQEMGQICVILIKLYIFLVSNKNYVYVLLTFNVNLKRQIYKNPGCALYNPLVLSPVFIFYTSVGYYHQNHITYIVFLHLYHYNSSHIGSRHKEL